MTEEKIIMKAIVVTDQAAGTAGMKLVERPASRPAVEIPALISTRKVTIFSCRLHLTGSQIAF